MVFHCHITQDLEDLNWKISFREIQKMKKTEFAIMVKRKLEYKTLKDLVNKKETHSKVKNVKHPLLKMQQYLMASNENMKIEDSQNIFRMRCKVTKTKMNMKQLYNSYECRACYREYENDKHVLECTILLKMNKEYEDVKVPEYEKLYKGNPKEQLEISRMFMSNMKILENIKEENQNLSNILDPCDQSYFSASAVYTGTMYKLNWNKLID